MATTTVLLASAPQQPIAITLVNVAANTAGGPQGLAAIPDTIQPAQANALGLEGVMGFGFPPNEFFNDNTAAPVIWPALTSLEALRTALDSFLDRDSAVVAFTLLPPDVQ